MKAELEPRPFGETNRSILLSLIYGCNPKLNSMRGKENNGVALTDSQAWPRFYDRPRQSGYVSFYLKKLRQIDSPKILLDKQGVIGLVVEVEAQFRRLNNETVKQLSQREARET